MRAAICFPGRLSQPVQVLPRPGGVAQDVGAVLRKAFGSPFADDDPGHDAGQDQVRQQPELAGRERGRRVVAGDQVKPGTERVGTIAQHVGDGDGEVVHQRGHGHVAEVDDPADAAGVGADQRVVRAEVVVHQLGSLLCQPRRQAGREPGELLAGQVRGVRPQRAQLRQLGQVPQQRPVHQRVVEVAQGPAELGQGDPEGAAQRLVGGDRAERAAVEVREHVHDATAQRAVRDDVPRLPADGGHDPRHGQRGRGRLDVPQHPDLDADHRRIGAQVRELHHVALVVAGLEEKVVAGLAGQPGELAGQAEAGLDGFGRLGRGDRRGRGQPGHVQGGVWCHVTAFRTGQRGAGQGGKPGPFGLIVVQGAARVK